MVWHSLYDPGAKATAVLTPPCRPLLQESEGVSCHYWSLFDGHAGSGAAVVASRLLQHHITEQLQDIVDILKNSAVLPPTCLGEEPENTPANSRTLTRAASLRGGVGAPGSPSTPPTRFFTEKKIPHECLVIGALESAFKEMVGNPGSPGQEGQAGTCARSVHPCWRAPRTHMVLPLAPPGQSPVIMGLPFPIEVGGRQSSWHLVLAKM
ncbi:hypothetical protein P7K49_040980 [Saguinus oedipus]|uniref:PPM-type phosphatase domain-containing protein n=1 Tax=Saguinus oedipus TaxID=9490 RepID=A0ABQ9T9A6_SAGOE|nr:hypothetical protein P7K49_040980 [Saguinus oedipus]